MKQLRFPVTKKEAEKAGVPYSSEANKTALFPSRLRALREEMGVSQATLASILGVSKSTIGLYETGDTLPDIKTADQLASYFEVTADYLIGRTAVKSECAEIRTMCDYSGLSELAIEELHDLKLEPDMACISVLNRLLENETFEYLLSYIDYAGRTLREAKRVHGKEPYIEDFRELSKAVDEVQATMTRVGLINYKLVDEYEFSSYVRGVLQHQFMDTFDSLFANVDEAPEDQANI